MGRLEPERYKVQFTATDEYVRLVEEAKALLSHADPNVKLEDRQMRAMRALITELKKRKYAAACATNVTLHCGAHNALAAEKDFGREFMEGRKDPLRRVSSIERAALARTRSGRYGSGKD